MSNTLYKITDRFPGGKRLYCRERILWNANNLQGKASTNNRKGLLYIIMVIAIIRFGSGHPNVCIICEYDALPGIGHACGHNLIAEAGVAAGLGVKAFIESQGTGYTGMVTMMGTPAEEGGGGKVLIIEKGAFEGVDITIMAHPCPFESVVCIANARMILKIDYHDKAAHDHAAAFP